MTLVTTDSEAFSRFLSSNSNALHHWRTMMTLETAKAILNISRRDGSRPSQTDHTDTDRAAFESRMTRLRPRTFLRTVLRSS